MEELVQVFLEESREILQKLENDLLEMEKNPEDHEIIKGIFRAAHTIKGSAGLIGLDAISTLAHRMEDVLDQVRSTGEPMTKKCYDTVFQSMDMLSRMVDMTAEGEQIPPGMADELKELLIFFIGGKEPLVSVQSKCEEDKPVVLTGKSVFKISMNFKPDIMESGNDPLRLIEELCGKGRVLEVNLNISKLPDLDEIDPYNMYLSWSVALETGCTYDELEAVFVFVVDDNRIKIDDITDSYGDVEGMAELKTGELLVNQDLIDDEQLIDSLKKQKRIGEILVEENKVTPKQIESVLDKQKTARDSQQVNTIRVDTRRLENVLNYVAELVITQSKVKELVSKQSQVDPEVFSSFREADKIIRRIQEEVMKTSMVPIGNTFTRFQRMVRDTAAEKGKEIEMVIKGQETELDKRVIEQINDPLKHMIRNSIDHGIEMPDERQAQGKPRQGTIWLNAYHQEGSIIIEVSDDGQGLDGEKIRQKAVEKGLIDEEQKMSASEMQKLIMMPGFSTAEKVTDISGRGVGLDVVATNIMALRGSIYCESEKGKGTKFIIKLPLTLAIIDGMMVTVGSEKFIIPLTSIVKFIKANSGDIKTIEGAGRAIHLRNEYIPMVALYKLLGLTAYKEDPTEGLLVIIKDARKKMALLVDDILGQEQVVTKSLSENYQQVEGVDGATILGDGRVAAILDVPTLVRMASKV